MNYPMDGKNAVEKTHLVPPISAKDAEMDGTHRQCLVTGSIGKMQEFAETSTKSRHLGTLEIDLAVDRHQHLHSLQPPISVGNAGALMDRLICKVFNGMSKDFQRMASLGSDAAAGGANTNGGKG